MRILIFSLFCSVSFLSSSLYADDSDIYDLLGRMESSSYKQVEGEDLIRLLLVKCVDIDSNLADISSDLQLIRNDINTLSTDKDSGLVCLESDVFIFELMILAGIWGSVLYICFVQKGLKV